MYIVYFASYLHTSRRIVDFIQQISRQSIREITLYEMVRLKNN